MVLFVMSMLTYADDDDMVVLAMLISDGGLWLMVDCLLMIDDWRLLISDVHEDAVVVDTDGYIFMADGDGGGDDC